MEYLDHHNKNSTSEHALPTPISQPWKLDITTILFIATGLYLFLSLLFYPYGFVLIGTAFFRFGDLVALLIFGIAILLAVIHKRMRGTILVFWPILPLLVVDMLMPLAGAVMFNTIDGVSNALRILVMHGIILAVASFTCTHRLDELIRVVVLVLKIGLLANLMYAILQILVNANVLSENVLFLRFLEPFSDGSIQDNTTRPKGFFDIVMDLAELGIIGLAFFLARYRHSQQLSDLAFAIIGLIIVIISTSRATLVVALVIGGLFLGSYFTRLSWRNITQISRILLLVFLFGGVFFWWINSVIDTERYFYRVMILTSGDILEDGSWSTRVEKRWPYLLRKVEQSYPFGTLLNPHDVLGPMDSEYIAHYVQGRFLGILPVIWLFTSLVYLTVIRQCNRRSWVRSFLLYLTIYAGLHGVVAIVLSSSIFLFWLYFALWMLYADQQGYLSFGSRGQLS